MNEADGRLDAVNPVVVWFRDDLRLADNPALDAASRTSRPLVCVFVHETGEEEPRPLGAAARWWLRNALLELDRALRAHGGCLWLFAGSARRIVPGLASACRASAVFWNRRYGEAERRIDESVKTTLKRKDVEARSFNGHLLYEPWTVTNSARAPFRVFSAFWRAARASGEVEMPLPAPPRMSFSSEHRELTSSSVGLADLHLEPTAPDWAGGLRASWRPGETAAQARLDAFLEEGFSVYAGSRDRPDRAATSRLSPYLRFGNISVRQAWHAASAAAHAKKPGFADRNLEKFQSELGWREFSYHLLYHNPAMAERNLQPSFDRMPWRNDRHGVKAWQQGKTGYPIVDAGMRELWTTGWMHNRVRMVVASFLIKDMLIDWRQGEAWFWDTLVDADPANNAASWQWVAGSGADAAPFFRIFNPVLQGEKFDPDGAYIRRWIPELRELPARFVHRPWEAMSQGLPGKDDPAAGYSPPILDHRQARARALEAVKSLE